MVYLGHVGVLYFIFRETSALIFIVTTKNLATVPIADKMPGPQQKGCNHFAPQHKGPAILVGKWRHRELEAAGNMVLLQEEEDSEHFCSVN